MAKGGKQQGGSTSELGGLVFTARKSTGNHVKINHLDGRNVGVKIVGPKATRRR